MEAQPPNAGETPALPGDGFFWCGHCSHVIPLAADCEADRTYKCPRCHKWTVRWRFPMKSKEKPQRLPIPVPQERALELFASLKNAAA